MSSRHAVRRSRWISRTRFALIESRELLNLSMPIGTCWGMRAKPGFSVVDRRCLARYIRREVLSIQRDIDSLKAQL